MERLVLFFLICCLDQVNLVASRCPKPCTCALKFGKKTVFCSGGGLSIIPVSEMDINIHELIITAPPENPNNITLGRIFHKFSSLETVRITRSGVPAIGDSSFWPGRRLRVLDLSHNTISFLLESDFNGLKGLLELDLSDNEIFATPSAPFHHLLSLRKLSLARNRLQNLVPRFFYLLSNLEELDLSGNTIGEIEPDYLQDIKNLKILKVSRCRLLQLHPLVYQMLPKLEVLDLRDNYLSSLAPAEFRHLSNLSMLLLDGNILSSLTEGTFHGHKFHLLSLSRNNLTLLSTNAFSNSKVTSLDMSHNKLEYVLKDTFLPLEESLEILNISYNNLGSQAFSSVVHHLKNVKILHATNLQVKVLSPEVFKQNNQIQILDLQKNHIEEIEPDVIQPLENLVELDLSYNKLTLISDLFFETLFNFTFFRAFQIDGNPFDCSSCLITPVFRFANESQLFDRNNSDFSCLQCGMPPEMRGSCILSLSSHDLMCQNAKYDRQFLEYTSQVGFIVAVSIIVVIVCIILVIIIIYRRHIAHYYTHEEEQRAWKGMYENPALAPSGGVHYSEEKSTFVSTGEKVDENIDDFRR